MSTRVQLNILPLIKHKTATLYSVPYLAKCPQVCADSISLAPSCCTVMSCQCCGHANHQQWQSLSPNCCWQIADKFVRAAELPASGLFWLARDVNGLKGARESLHARLFRCCGHTDRMQTSGAKPFKTLWHQFITMTPALSDSIAKSLGEEWNMLSIDPEIDCDRWYTHKKEIDCWELCFRVCFPFEIADKPKVD